MRAAVRPAQRAEALPAMPLTPDRRNDPCTTSGSGLATRTKATLATRPKAAGYLLAPAGVRPKIAVRPANVACPPNSCPKQRRETTKAKIETAGVRPKPAAEARPETPTETGFGNRVATVADECAYVAGELTRTSVDPRGSRLTPRTSDHEVGGSDYDRVGLEVRDSESLGTKSHKRTRAPFGNQAKSRRTGSATTKGGMGANMGTLNEASSSESDFEDWSGAPSERAQFACAAGMTPEEYQAELEQEVRSRVSLDFPYERAQAAFAAGLTPEEFRAELEQEGASSSSTRMDAVDPTLRYREVLTEANSFLTEWELMSARATCVASSAAADFQTTRS